MQKNKAITMALIGFFILMFVLTMISHAADSIVVPRVTTTTLQASSLSYCVSGKGFVEEKSKRYMDLMENVRVDRVYRQRGDAVKQGTKILQYRVEDLQQLLEEKNNQIRKLELQIEEKKIETSNSGAYKENQKLQLAYEKAKEDYDDAKEKLTELKKEQKKASSLSLKELIKQQKAKCSSLQTKILKKQEEIDDLVTINDIKEEKANRSLARKQAKMDKIKEEIDAIENGTFNRKDIIAEQDKILDEAEKNYEQALTNMGSGTYQTSYEIKLFKNAEKKYQDLRDSYQDDIEAKVKKIQEQDKQDYNELAEQYADEKSDYDILVVNNENAEENASDELASLKEEKNKEKALLDKMENGTFSMDSLKEQQESELEQAITKVKDAKYTLDSAKLDWESEIENAYQQASNDSDSKQTKQLLLNLELESLSMDMDQVKEGKEELEALIRDNGYVRSELQGILGEMDVTEGKKVQPDSVIEIGLEDYQFKATITESDEEHLKIGDELEVINEARNLKGSAKVLSIAAKQDDDGLPVVEVIAELPKEFEKNENMKPGLMMAFSYKEMTDLYENCIPLSAVRGAENDAYVYVIGERDTILGKQNVVEKRSVKVKTKDSSTAVLENLSQLGEQEKIIATSNKIIYEGDRVRM